jgi:hypothetical protein
MINQHPELIKEYYSYTVRTYYHLFTIPFLLLVAFLFLIQVKGVYPLYIEAYRVVQILGLLVYSAFPIGPYTYYFLIGCSYCNFDFVPNLYAVLAKSDNSQVFASYFLASDGMDFVRLMGSIILFGVFMLCVYLVCRFLIGVKQSRLDFVVRLAIDLIEVKVLHSFWSALLFIVANYQATEFSIFVTFILAIVFLGGIIGRRYSIYKETGDFGPFFFWRAAATLTICFVAMANEVVVSVLVVLAMATTLCEFWLLHSPRYYLNINDLNSANYMEERTYRVLNNYDMEVPYSFSISLRNAHTTLCPLLTALLIGVLVLLRDA